MVPGISSSLAVPAMQNIPLTKRDSSQSFWVITGTTKDRTISKDIALAAQSTATVVILMGMSKLPQIVTLFQAAGKSNLPVAIIQNGTTLHEKIAVGTIDTIEREVEINGLSNPAVIVIGEVVRHRESLFSIHEKVYVKKSL